MKTFYEVVGDALRKGPSERVERLSPWIIAALGAAMLGLALYCWFTAWYG